MPEIARLSGHSEWIDLDFVERDRTPEPAMALGIQSNVAGLSLSNTASYSTVWVSNAAGKQSTIGCRKPIYSPNLGNLRIRLRSTKQ
jgi:hypothetical protein